MEMEILGIFGFACLGYLLPEYLIIVSSRAINVPHGLNWLSCTGVTSVAAWAICG